MILCEDVARYGIERLFGFETLLLFGKALFLFVLDEIRAKDSASLKFGAFRLRCDDVAFLRVADDFGFVGAAS